MPGVKYLIVVLIVKSGFAEPVQYKAASANAGGYQAGIAASPKSSCALFVTSLEFIALTNSSS